MAVKFSRTPSRRQGKGSHGRIGNVGMSSPLGLKRRLFIIYIGLGMAAIFLLAFHSTGLFKPSPWQPEQRGEGVIVEKLVYDEGTAKARYYLSVGVYVDDELDSGPASKPLIDHVATDEKSWKLVGEGTRVTVEYLYNPGNLRVAVKTITLKEAPQSDPKPEEISNSEEGLSAEP